MNATTESGDPFEKLITLCIKSFSVTFNDTIALDANGVIGKQRVMILDNERYQRETRKLKAKRTIDDLKDIDALMDGMDDAEEKEGEEEEGAVELTPDEDERPDAGLTVDFTEEYDIRDPDSAKKIIEKKKREAAKTIVAEKKSVGRPPNTKRKYFDKSKVEMRLKLLASRRDILDSSKGEEEKETDALNIFFIPVTKEEFERISTVEVSEGSGDNAFDAAETSKAQNQALGGALSKKVKEGMKPSADFHIEVINGEQTVVED
jgi:hypothetical protein